MLLLLLQGCFGLWAKNLPSWIILNTHLPALLASCRRQVCPESSQDHQGSLSILNTCLFKLSQSISHLVRTYSFIFIASIFKLFFTTLTERGEFKFSSLRVQLIYFILFTKTTRTQLDRQCQKGSTTGNHRIQLFCRCFEDFRNFPGDVPLLMYVRMSFLKACRRCDWRLTSTCSTSQPRIHVICING